MKQIPLSQGKFALVDDEHFDALVAITKWHAAKNKRTYYGQGSIWIPELKRGRTVMLHREVGRLLGFDMTKQVDHRDGNGLNCQAANLREATHQNNMQNRQRLPSNTSGYIGVSARGNKFTAKAKHNGLNLYFGDFDDAISAAKAYDENIRKLRGDFARTNFPLPA